MEDEVAGEGGSGLTGGEQVKTMIRKESDRPGVGRRAEGARRLWRQRLRCRCARAGRQAFWETSIFSEASMTMVN